MDGWLVVLWSIQQFSVILSQWKGDKDKWKSVGNVTHLWLERILPSKMSIFFPLKVDLWRTSSSKKANKKLNWQLFPNTTRTQLNALSHLPEHCHSVWVELNPKYLTKFSAPLLTLDKYYLNLASASCWWDKQCSKNGGIFMKFLAVTC